MAEPFGPDEELRARRAAYDAAMKRLNAAKEQYGQAEGFRGTQAGDRAESELRAAEDSVRSTAEHYNRGLEQHPENQYRQILDEAAKVKAPQLSDWDWFRQNPGFLTAEPLSEDERSANARLDFILRRVHEAQQGQSPHDPMSWANYRGPLSGAMDDFTVASAEAYGWQGLPGDPSYLEKLRSPYRHRAPFQDEQGHTLPWYDKESGHYPLMADAAQLGATAAVFSKWPKPILAFNALSTAHNTAIPVYQRLAEGRMADAADSLARAPLGVLNPAYSAGREGGPHDWRVGVPSELSSSIDVLAETVPWFVGVPRRRALPAGQRIRSLADPGALNAAYRQAAWRLHPDYGGSTEAMQLLNAARDRGDIGAIIRMSQ